jgi:hypothetical protein
MRNFIVPYVHLWGEVRWGEVYQLMDVYCREAVCTYDKQNLHRAYIILVGKRPLETPSSRVGHINTLRSGKSLWHLLSFKCFSRHREIRENNKLIRLQFNDPFLWIIFSCYRFQLCCIYQICPKSFVRSLCLQFLTQRIFHTKSARMFIIYLHTTFHKPSFNMPLNFTVKPDVNINFARQSIYCITFLKKVIRQKLYIHRRSTITHIKNDEMEKWEMRTKF